MIPEELYDTYEQYKKGTKTVITYLASKGHECGYQLEHLREKIAEPAGDKSKRKFLGNKRAMHRPLPLKLQRKSISSLFHPSAP
jgi:hypothetical protein